MLEIKDPELNVLALAGKVTWFDPKRSKYCIVASGHGGSGGGGGTSSGGGEPKEGCSHWITVGKLVEAKAIAVQRNGKRFVVGPLPLLDGEDAERRHLNNSVKMAQNNEGDGGQKESGVLSARDKGEKKKEARESEGGASVGWQETGLDEEDVGTTATGKRRRKDTLPSSGSPSDVAPANHTAARPEKPSRQARAPLELGMQPTLSVPGEAVEAPRSPSPGVEGSKSSTESKVASESESGGTRSTEVEGRSAATSSLTPQPTRLLPSVQLQDKQPDAFARYPIRGRQKRPENLTSDRAVQRGLEGVPSAKRPRVEGEVDQGLDVTADAIPDPSDMELACPGEDAVAGDPVRSASSGVCRTPHESGIPFELEPGWPHGMGLLGQVPVMRVRAVRVPGGVDATYFASAYASVAEGVICAKRSAPSFSFSFEDLEEMKLTRSGTKQLQQATDTGSLSEHPDQSCKLSGDLKGQEGKESTLDDAETRPSGEAEASRTLLSSELGQEKESGKGNEKGGEGPVDETNLSSDGGDVEDGEIGTVSDERADAMPPSPRSEGGSCGSVVERLSPAGEQVAKGGAGNNEQTTQPACQSSVKSEDESATKAKGMEEMEISSDDVSCGGFEGAEAASPYISEDDEDEDDDIGLSWELFRDGGITPEPSRVDTQSSNPMPGATGARPVPSSSETELTEVLRGPRSLKSGEPVQNSESCLDVVASDEARPQSRKSSAIEATEVDEQAFPATSTGGLMPRLEQERSATEREPEIEAVQALAPQQTGVTTALRSIVREQLQGVLRSASKGKEAVLAGGDGNDVLERIASDTEDELFRRLYKDITGGREYKVR